MSVSSNPRHNVSIEVTVGVFVAAVFTALCVFTIAISGSTLFRNNQSTIKVILPDAMGLRRNDLVIARGTSVGVVDDVYYDQDGIHVVAKLNAPVVFHEGYRISVVQTSILGGRQLVIFEGNPDAPRVTEITSLKGEAPSNLMDDATEVVSKFREFMAGDFFKNLDKTAANIADISDRLNKGEGTFGKLLSSDDTLYNNLSETVTDLRNFVKGDFLSNLDKTSVNIAEISDRLNKGEGTLGKLLSPDDTLYNDISSAIGDIRKFTQGDFFANLDKASANISDISDRLNRGEGTLGKLLSSDDMLYRNINGVVIDAREYLDDLRETTPVSTFTSFIFGAF